MNKFDAAIASSQGARRYQEDAAAFSGSAAGELVAVLADGMGGHAGGAIASRIACDTFLASFGLASGATGERLARSLDTANIALARAVAAAPALAGMGTTLVGVVFEADGLSWVSVGDSPLYVYRNTAVTRLNADHSLAPSLDRMAAEGRITCEQALADPQRHMLRSAVTGDMIDLVDQADYPIGFSAGEYALLASDGINVLSEPEIAAIVADNGSLGAKAVADAVIKSALDAKDPHQDNVTVLAVRLSPAYAGDDGR